MQKILLEKLREAFASVLPITLIVLLVSYTPLVTFSLKELVVFTISAVFLIVGIGLFNLGADLAMTPMGMYVGAGLTKSRRLLLLVSVCFVMGVLITVAEPDLSVLAEQVKNAVQPLLLISTIGVGVGIFFAARDFEDCIQERPFVDYHFLLHGAVHARDAHGVCRAGCVCSACV